MSVTQVRQFLVSWELPPDGAQTFVFGLLPTIGKRLELLHVLTTRPGTVERVLSNPGSNAKPIGCGQKRIEKRGTGSHVCPESKT